MFTTVVLASMMFLILASWSDLKTGEVPEEYSLGLAATAAAASIFSAAYYWDLRYITYPVFWGVLAFAAAYVPFYFGQWGGGDVKLLGGLGGLLGLLDASGWVWPNASFMGFRIGYLTLAYFINMAVLSTPYAVTYTLFLGLRRPHVFGVFFRRLVSPPVLFSLAASLTLLVASALSFSSSPIIYLYVFVPLLIVASVYMKTVEDVLLTKTVNVADLREWDIIVEDVFSGGVKVASGGNIEGITPKQLSVIRELAAAGKIPDTIKTKWGVKFVPVIMLSLPVTLYCGNILEPVFKALVDFQ